MNWGVGEYRARSRKKSLGVALSEDYNEKPPVKGASS